LSILTDKFIKTLKKIKLNSKWISIPFLIIIFYFIFKYFKNNINDLKEYEFNFRITRLIVSGLLIWLAMTVNSFVYHKIISSLDPKAKLGQNIRIWFYSYLGRYFPGKVGLLASRIYLHKQQNISGRIAVFAFYLETLVSAITTLFIYLLSTIIYNYPFLQDYKIFSYILLAICFIALHPGIVRFQLSLLMKFKGDKQELDINLNYSTLIIIFLLRIIIWCTLGLSFYFIINSFYVVSFSYFPYLTGIFALGAIIGLFAVFAPTGLGVLEGILLIGLKYIVPDGIAVVISISVRIVKIIAELSIIFIVYGIVKLFKLSSHVSLLNMGKDG